VALVKDILAEKGAEVITVQPQESVLKAARLMNEYKIGSLVVTEGDLVVGIFTERDVLQRVVAEGKNPGSTLVSEVMTRHVACCRPQTTIEEARTVMRNRRIRHLPVVDEDRQLFGLISIGDLNAWELNGQELTIHFLHEYLYGQT
jgi:CBS domain-containing protein